MLLSKQLLHKWHETVLLTRDTKSRNGRARRLKNQRTISHINMIDAINRLGAAPARRHGPDPSIGRCTSMQGTSDSRSAG
jgi:hypothetical protein